MFIYLAGAMSYYDRINRFELATKWRKRIINRLQHTRYITSDYEIFDPCVHYDINKTFNSNGVVYQNLVYLRKADILILNLDDIDKSFGTLFEIYYAFLNHIPVIAFGENDLYYTQPHIRASITMKCDNIDQVVEYIVNMYSVK